MGQLIQNKTISMNDTDPNGKTLLALAAYYGNLEVAKLCINLGYDINASSTKAANDMSNHDVEQLLMLSKITGNIGERVKEKADGLNKEDGMIANVINELSKIKDEKLSFKDTLIQVVTNLIDQKLSFPDFLLSLCWKMMETEYEKPEESELFKVIMVTCEDIIKKKDKRDWYWMKQIMLKSHVWLREAYDFNYLYYKLLKLVEVESKRQV